MSTTQVLVTDFVAGVGTALVLYRLVAQPHQFMPFMPSKAKQLRSIHSPMEK